MKKKYLSYVPKTLQDDFIRNRVIPFVGAGFSKNAELPQNVDMPDWDGLGKKVADYLPEYTYTNAIDAFSLFESEFSRAKLIELLAKELKIHEIQAGDTHKSFCDLYFDTICTTNFDFLLEQALNERNIPYSTIVSEDRLPVYTHEKTKLIKMHGDFNHPERMVISENDFDNFIDNNKVLSTYISNLFITKTLLLIGYSFEDNDIRTLWKMIGSRLGKLQTPAYVILVNASSIEISRFERRNIKVINLPGDKADYPKILTDFFREIKELINEEIPQKMIITNEKASEELRMPREENKLCFISAPYQRLSFLKELVYPVLKTKNLSPLSFDEAIMPGEIIARKIDAIISRASLAIVDISEHNNNAMWQIGNMMSKNIDIILIAEIDKPILLPLNLQGMSWLTYSLTGDNTRFVEMLQERLDTFCNKRQKIDAQPDYKRLFDKGEYEAAVIMVFRYLDNTIYIKRGNLKCEPMIYKLHGNTKLAEEKLSQMQKFRRIRNNVVHTNINIQKKDAEKIIDYIEEICRLIESGDISF